MAKKEPKPRNLKKGEQKETQEPVQVTESETETVQTSIVLVSGSGLIENPNPVNPFAEQEQVGVVEQVPTQVPRRLNKTQMRRKEYWDDYNAKNGISAE